MEELANCTKALADRLRPLGGLISGKAILDYFGTCIKRIIEPYLVRHKLNVDAGTRERLYAHHPLTRIEALQSLSEQNPSVLPEVSKESLDNAFKIGEYALAYINGDKKNASSAKSLPDDEWLDRFVDEAKYVSNEQLQHVFGRLLKEKIVNPSAVNKRVLKIIRDMDTSELGTIQKYMSCFLQDAIPTVVMDEFDFGLDMLVELQNIGLVNLVNAPDAFHSIQKTYNIDRNGCTIDMKGYQFVFSEVQKPFEVSFDSYLLTKEGIVVYNLMNKQMPNDVMRMYQRIFSRECSGKASLSVKMLPLQNDD